MAKSIKPVAKSVYVCDDVIRDPHTGKASLLNLWDAVRVPNGEKFPYSLAKICLFVWWRDAIGKIKTRIDLVQASTGKVIRRTDDYVMNFEARRESVLARYKLENWAFPDPGYYYL